MSVGFHNPKGSAPYKAQKGDLGMKHGMVGGGSASKRGYSLAAIVMVSMALAGLGAIFMVVIDRRSLAGCQWQSRSQRPRSSRQRSPRR